MIGNKHLLSNILPYSLDYVTFGDGSKGSVLGLGYLNIQGFPKLRDVQLVDGLKANMISINQSCNQAPFVKIHKKKVHCL